MFEVQFLSSGIKYVIYIIIHIINILSNAREKAKGESLDIILNTRSSFLYSGLILSNLVVGQKCQKIDSGHRSIENLMRLIQCLSDFSILIF